MTAVMHLVTGSTGAGKTTYALALAADAHAIRLSIDEWMVALFGPDQPERLAFEWMIERVNRCEAQMWSVAQQAAALGMSIVIDCGLTTANHRANWAELAATADLPVRLHVLDVAVETRWSRVQRRNADRGPTFRLEVTREMFDFVETLWEPPDAAEIARLNGSLVATPPDVSR